MTIIIRVRMLSLFEWTTSKAKDHSPFTFKGILEIRHWERSKKYNHYGRNFFFFFHNIAQMNKRTKDHHQNFRIEFRVN